MEKWRALFRERFVIEENTEEQYLRKYDHRTIVEELEHFIEQELDKAREEIKREIFYHIGLDGLIDPTSEILDKTYTELLSQLREEPVSVKFVSKLLEQ